ncbi:MAG: long-chain fatty acid--CoA ligase [Rhodospirillales bacterium]|nr:long-chain fatty acid--CoA ligase [Rhodospirillales bacterium]
MARRFSHGRFFDWIRDNGITVVAGVPTVVNMLLSKPVAVTGDDLPSLRLMTSSSAPLAPDQWRAFEELYKIKLLQFYGASEGGWLCGNRHDWCKLGTAGLAARHMDLAIIDGDGATCPPDVEGEITIRGPQTAVATITPDGVYEDHRPYRLIDRMRSGDLGVMDSDGFVTVTGRVKDLIIRGGVNIAPLEIDGVVMRHDKIHEAAAVGIPDEIYGEEIICYVVLRDRAMLEDGKLDAHCRTILPHVKTPKRFITVTELPKSDRGKIRRDALKELWARHEKQGSQ